jgi:uncharacterized membrane protein
VPNNRKVGNKQFCSSGPSKGNTFCVYHFIYMSSDRNRLGRKAEQMDVGLLYVCACVCVYMCIYIYIYSHTHSLTHTQASHLI